MIVETGCNFRFSALARSAAFALAATSAVSASAQISAALGEGGASAQAQGEVSQTGSSGMGFMIVPRLSLTEVVTNNVQLQSQGQSDTITQLNAGLNLKYRGARLSAYLDYSLSEYIYAKNSAESTRQNALNAFGSLRAIDDWAFIDFSSTISQQAISAFGPSSNDTGANANLTETFVTQLSPYVRGRLSGGVNYEARFTWISQRSELNQTSNYTSRQGMLTFSNQDSGSKLHWTVSGISQRYDYTVVRTTDDDRLHLTLRYLITPQFSLSLLGGRETTNLTSLADETHGSGGWGLDWVPSEATRVALSRESRYFGETHSVSAEHRTPRTEWRYSNIRDITAGTGQPGNGSVGTVYDLIYAQFAGLEPDPIKRADLVNSYLLVYGLSPNTKVNSGFLSSAVSLQRMQSLSFAILGVRDTITFIASQSNTQRLDTVSAVPTDDLVNAGPIRQRGFTMSYSHRLTPMASLALLASQQDTSGATGGTADTTTRTLNLNFRPGLARSPLPPWVHAECCPRGVSTPIPSLP